MTGLRGRHVPTGRVGIVQGVFNFFLRVPSSRHRTIVSVCWLLSTPMLYFVNRIAGNSTVAVPARRRMGHELKMTLNFDLEQLGWKSFQDLCLTICEHTYELRVGTFSGGPDSGRDGA